jgi:hypothetical protein
MYTRPQGEKGFFYYQLIRLTAALTGTYKIRSNSDIKTLIYFYNGPFHPSYPPLNLDEDYDHSDADLDFSLTVSLQANVMYYIVITTDEAAQIGSFTVYVDGPADVDLAYIETGTLR